MQLKNTSTKMIVTGHIISSAILRVLSFNESLEDAIEARRLHHQLSPNEVTVEGKIYNSPGPDSYKVFPR